MPIWPRMYEFIYKFVYRCCARLCCLSSWFLRSGVCPQMDPSKVKGIVQGKGVILTPKLIPVAYDLISKMNSSIWAQSYWSRLLAYTGICTDPVLDSDFPYLLCSIAANHFWESFDPGAQCGSLQAVVAAAVCFVASTPGSEHTLVWDWYFQHSSPKDTRGYYCFAVSPASTEWATLRTESSVLMVLWLSNWVSWCHWETGIVSLATVPR